MVSFSTVPGPSVVRRGQAVHRYTLVDHGFKCVAFDLLAAASVADVCVVMRSEGKGTGQIDRKPQQQTSQLRLRKN